MTHRPRNEYLEELAGVPLFAGCWRRDLELVAKNVDAVDVVDGRVIVTEGTTGHQLYVIVRGAATLARDGSPIGVLREGDWFGEGPALAGARYPATVIAAGSTRVIVIGRREVLALAHAIPGLARHLLRGMAERLGKRESGGSVTPSAGEEVPDDPGAAPEPRRPLRA